MFNMYQVELILATQVEKIALRANPVDDLVSLVGKHVTTNQYRFSFDFASITDFEAKIRSMAGASFV